MELDRIEQQGTFLRCPTQADAPAMYTGWCRDPEVTKYLIWAPHTDISETRGFLDYVQTAWTNRTELTWLICRTSDDQPMGTISLLIDGHKGGLGFALARPFWRQGHMGPVITSVLKLGFQDLGLARIGGVCDVDNVASARTMESLGYEREGLLRKWLVCPTLAPEPRDCYSYAMTDDQWRRLNSKAADQ